jgi:hypothetical protein
MMPLRFAPLDSRIAVTPRIAEALMRSRKPTELIEWADLAATTIDTKPYGVVFEIGALRWCLNESRRLAISIVEFVSDAFKRAGAPQEMRVEVDEPQDSYVEESYQTRTLIPHHDSAHCSYLTPSLFEDQAWDPQMRRFSPAGITSTSSHKMYQGFIVLNPGECLSMTTFYDKVALLAAAYRHRSGRPRATLSAVARWAGENIRSLWELRDQYDLKYLPLGAELGATHPMFRLVPIHLAEADFSSELITRFPELSVFRDALTGGNTSPTRRFFEELLQDALGQTAAEFRNQYELCVASERYDLILGHNLTNLHGGYLGGRRRKLQPVCLVTDAPSGASYEKWLARSWRQHWVHVGTSESAADR